MEKDPKKSKELALNRRKVHRKLTNRLGKVPPKKLDPLFHQLHDEVFEEMDCLACANCCKTTSPLFISKDVERIASHLGMKAYDFEQQYLQTDEDGDLVLQQAPCPFLGEDNYCSIYSVRPRACREYPHTNRKNMYQILNLTQKNTRVCPAVLEIFERIPSRL